MRTRLIALVSVVVLLVAACSSGPSSPDLRPPTSTTTTEAPEVGIEIVRIRNGSFQPPQLRIDIDETPTVRFVHDDNPEVTYTIITSNGPWEDFELADGGEHDIDFTGVEPQLYRFSAIAGFVRLPFSIDARPDI